MTERSEPFRCPFCGIVSHHPRDAQERYCARCHRFVDEQPFVPGYWMHESSGVLRPVIEDYLHNRPLSYAQIATMRAYLRQWIMAPCWQNVDELRAGIDSLTTREAVHNWLERALDAGIDPL